MFEREVQIESGGARLFGTACVPRASGRFPTVLMVHGSGPLDRDENMKGQRLDVFNAVARRLADSGVASVRYDKRGCGKSSGDYYRVGYNDLVHDVVGWVDALRGYDFVEESKLFLLGHSEGCLIAAQVSSQRPVAGLVLLCPFFQGTKAILLKQARQIELDIEEARGVGGALQRLLVKVLGRPVASQEALLKAIESSSDDVIRRGLQWIPAKWLRELMATEASDVFARTACPMLLVAGEKDLQCDPADVLRIAETAPGEVEKQVIPNLTHVLRFEEHKPSLLQTARLLRNPVEPIVLESIVSWLEKRCAGARRRELG